MPTRIDLPIDQITAAYKEGATLKELAAEHGCSYYTIAGRLKEAGVKMPGPGRPRTLAAGRRDCTIAITLTQEERAVIERSLAPGESLTSYARRALGLEV